MHHIEALTAGIRGAEHGFARIYARGTSTRAPIYSDFEGTSVDQSGSDIQLDGYGRAIVYVNRTVKVVVVDASGATVLEFVSSAAAGNVEYQGQGFTGRRYVNNQAGAGSGFPTTAQAIFDLAKTSFGAPDWQVLVNGAPTNIGEALGGVIGVVFNVKSPEFGAVGDGIADDQAAIQAAIDAAETAGGGVVYFPAGQYATEAALELPIEVHLFGAGAQSTALSVVAADESLIQISGGDYERPPRVIYGLTLSATNVNTEPLIAMDDEAHVAFRDCRLVHLGTSSDSQCILIDGNASRVLAHKCQFAVGTTSVANMIHNSEASELVFDACDFVTPLSYSPDDSIIYGGNVTALDCNFDHTKTTSGAIVDVSFSSTTVLGNIRGCKFPNPVGGTVTALALGSYASASYFFEADNVFGASVTAYSYTNAITQPTGQVVLRTRDARVYRASNAASPLSLPVSQYGVISILSTRAGNTSLVFDGTPPSGAKGLVMIRNEDGSSRTFTPPIIFTGPAASIGSNSQNDLFYQIGSQVNLGAPIQWIAGSWSV